MYVRRASSLCFFLRFVFFDVDKEKEEVALYVLVAAVVVLSTSVVEESFDKNRIRTHSRESGEKRLGPRECWGVVSLPLPL